MWQKVVENRYYFVGIFLLCTGLVVVSGCSDEAPSCAELEEQSDCRDRSECYFRGGDGVCVARDGSEGPVCEELQACSDSDDYDLCDGDGDCCAIEFSEVDLGAIENSDDTCAQYTASVTLCAPPEITFLDDFAELAQFVFEDGEGHKRMLLVTHGIAGFEETDLQPCRGAPEEYEDICASCEFM